jgi:hypothetical protein
LPDQFGRRSVPRAPSNVSLFSEEGAVLSESDVREVSQALYQISYSLFQINHLKDPFNRRQNLPRAPSNATLNSEEEAQLSSSDVREINQLPDVFRKSQPRAPASASTSMIGGERDSDGKHKIMINIGIEIEISKKDSKITAVKSKVVPFSSKAGVRSKKDCRSGKELRSTSKADVRSKKELRSTSKADVRSKKESRSTQKADGRSKKESRPKNEIRSVRLGRKSKKPVRSMR